MNPDKLQRLWERAQHYDDANDQWDNNIFSAWPALYAKLKAAEKCAEALRTALDCDQCHFVARAALEEWDKCS